MVKAKEPLKNGNGRKEYLTIWTYWWVQTCQRFWVNEDALYSPSGDIAVMGSMRCSGALLVCVIVCVVTLTYDLGSWLSLCFLALHILFQLDQNYTIMHPTGKRCTENLPSVLQMCDKINICILHLGNLMHLLFPVSVQYVCCRSLIFVVYHLWQTLNMETENGKKTLTFVPLAPACVVSISNTS